MPADKGKCFIWIPQGRLGNLIFQHQAISKLAGGARVLAPDSEFFDLFERSPRFLVVPCVRLLRGRLHRYWTSFFETLARRRLLGTLKPDVRLVLEKYPAETADIRRETGHFDSVFLVKGFFQTPEYMLPLPRLKPGVLRRAESRLAEIPKFQRVAIHMRFGDYSQWPMLGVPGSACLPASYYLNAMSVIGKSVAPARFLVLSDEPDKARAILASAGSGAHIQFVDGGTAADDFALIASCAHAVVSASSFSWWAASLIDNPARVLVAPKYWLGFSRRTWFPPDLESAHFVYIDALSG